jgi:hypothetical protein
MLLRLTLRSAAAIMKTVEEGNGLAERSANPHRLKFGNGTNHRD